MTGDEYTEEVRLTKRMLRKLEARVWVNGTRGIKWDYHGYHYEIEQLASPPTNDQRRDVAQTLYFRNNELHRTDGPAYNFNVDGISRKFYVVNGTLFTFNEFVFFVSGVSDD